MNISVSNGKIALSSEPPPSDSGFCPSSFEQLEPIQKSLYEYLSNCGDWVDEMLIAVSMDLPSAIRSIPKTIKDGRGATLLTDKAMRVKLPTLRDTVDPRSTHSD